MKNNTTFIIVIKKTLFLILFLSLNNAIAQISLGGLPYSMIHEEASNGRTLKSKSIQLPSINALQELVKAKEILDKCPTCPDYYGKVGDLKIDIKNDGIATKVKGGTVWIYNFEYNADYGLQFYFDKYKLPKRASLYIYNEDRSIILGAFTHINNHPDLRFATQLIPGKIITLEYFEADENEFKGELQIYKVVQSFKDIYEGRKPIQNGRVEGQGDALPCTVDINCNEGNPFQKEKKSVCRISVYDRFNDRTGYVTGTLLNNLQQPRKPYVLTAYHSLGKINYGDPITHRLDQWIFEFDYEKSSCDGIFISFPHSHQGANPVSGAYTDGPTYQADYLLLDLQTYTIEDWLDVVYLGWDKRSYINFPSASTIHHPDGDVKKIATSTLPPVAVATSFDGDIYHDYGQINPKNDWKISWTSGITMKGSSGAPLIDNGSKLAIGYLKAGSSTCNENGTGIISGPDYFGRLSYAWGNYDFQNFSYPIKHFLDPNNTNTEILTTYVPGASAPPGSGSGSSCLSLWSGIGLQPTYNLGTFDDDVVNSCISSWKLTHGRADGTCYTNPGNGIYRKAALLWMQNSHSSEIARPFSFEAGKEYVISLKVYSDGSTLTAYMGQLKILLKNQMALPGLTAPKPCGTWVGVPSIQTTDQVIMTLDKTKFRSNGDGKFNTYAIKFIPQSNYQYISLFYVPGTPNPNSAQASRLYVDEVFLFDKGKFINPQCYDNLSYYDSTFPINVSSNTSITLEKSSTTAPIISSGSVKSLKSKSIVLKDGFEARSGSVFSAFVNDCIDFTAQDNPVGPLDNNKLTTLLRIGSDSLSNPAVIFDYSMRSSIYRNLDAELTTKELNEDQLVIFPNPTNDKVTIMLDIIIQPSFYELYDLGGKFLERGKIDGLITLDMARYAAGIYILKISNGGRQIQRKILRN